MIEEKKKEANRRFFDRTTGIQRVYKQELLLSIYRLFRKSAKRMHDDAINDVTVNKDLSTEIIEVETNICAKRGENLSKHS